MPSRLASILLGLVPWAFWAAGAAAAPPTLPASAPADSVASFPCPRDPTSTLALEACEGRQLLRLDRTFNERSTVVWSRLDATGRREFVRANDAWLSYRDEECAASARAYLGGTASPVEYGSCEDELTAARDQELEQMVELYCQGSAGVGADNRCPPAPASAGGAAKKR